MRTMPSRKLIPDLAGMAVRPLMARDIMKKQMSQVMCLRMMIVLLSIFYFLKVL